MCVCMYFDTVVCIVWAVLYCVWGWLPVRTSVSWSGWLVAVRRSMRVLPSAPSSALCVLCL